MGADCQGVENPEAEKKLKPIHREPAQETQEIRFTFGEICQDH
jgi:hypothetical protein